MIFFVGDPHLGHRNIARFRSYVKDMEDNTNQFVTAWKQTVCKKHDIVYVLGDAAFSQAGLNVLASLQGRKILIKGNHDDMVSTRDQLNVFEEIHGMLKYKAMWLSHAPIHPNELRGKFNCHGHVHDATILKEDGTPDRRYLNCCVDALMKTYGKPIITLDEVRAYFWGS
jgi:calcineurin-like phosphoesterase family protein